MPRPVATEAIRKIASRLAVARERAGFTQATAAAGLGKNRWQTIGDWESGKVNFNLADFASMCALYKCSADWALGLCEVPDVPPGHAIIDLATERAVLRAKGIADLEVLASATLKRVEVIDLGYVVPREFAVVPKLEFDKRRSTVSDVVARLSPSSWIARMLAPLRKRARSEKGNHDDARDE